MPIRPPRLDDRTVRDLVAETLARIPGHAPEYTNPVPGDPGHTLIELFAWLTDTLLYRVNLVPERQRLEFLRMVGVPMRGPRPATGLVSLTMGGLDRANTAVVGEALRPWCRVSGPVDFETRTAVSVLPVTGVAYHKRRLRQAEESAVAPLLTDLARLYELGVSRPRPYVTTPTFPGDAAWPLGLDLARESIDTTLWVALLAGRVDRVEDAREALGKTPDGQRQVLSVGIVPRLEALADEIGTSTARPVPLIWEITSGVTGSHGPEYVRLDVLRDGTNGLTRTGVVNLVLPPSTGIGAPPNDVRREIDAGVGTRPPRIDDPAIDDRVVAWLRLRPGVVVDQLALSWVGINAVLLDQRRTLTDVVIGVSDGGPEQRLGLPLGGVERQTFRLQVHEEGLGWVDWAIVENLALMGRDERGYVLDDDEGAVLFGDGLRGRIPDAQRRIRVAFMRAGGGPEGNLSQDALNAIQAIRSRDGSAVSNMTVRQPVPTSGGSAAETLEEAERRIPDVLRHRDRAVTAADTVAVAASTPGIRLGRVEVLKGFKPHQRRTGVPGVVSVMVLPQIDGVMPPNPRPGRHTIEAVHEWVSARVPLATELYVIGCEYRPVGIGIGFELREGSDRDQTIEGIRLATRGLLWPLAPGGPFEDASGWPLHRAVRERELRVAISRVPGVDEITGVNLFELTQSKTWARVGAASDGAQMAMREWELPELLKLVVVVGEAPTSLDGTDGSGESDVGVPVVPEIC